MWIRALSGVFVLACAMPVLAQELIHSRIGDPAQRYLGFDADVLGDIDGDGFNDFAVVNLRTVGPVTACDLYHEIEFVSGRDGRVNRRRLGPSNRVAGFNKVRATGDVDGDGQPDYAVLIYDGATQMATIQVCRAMDDQVLWSASRHYLSTFFGSTVTSNLDVDGDGRKDVIVFARTMPGPDPNYWGSIIAYSSSGQRLYEVISRNPYSFAAAGLARDAAGVGDLDSDGCDDFIAAVTFQPGPNGLPGVGLFSGRTGTLIRFSPGEFGESLGYCVAALGDLDGDGVRDYAAGNGGDSFAPYGIVRTFSGRTGQRLGSWFEPLRTQYFGEVILGGMDADRDGIEDVWISSSAERIGFSGGVLRCFSGRDGRPLFVTSGLGSCGRYLLLGLGVQPDHPFPRYVVVNTCGPGLNCAARWGVIYLFRSNPSGVTPLGDACAGAASQPPQLGLYQRDGVGLRLSVSAAPPGALAGIFLGFSSTSVGAVSLPHPLDPYGFPGCSLFTSAEHAFTRLTGTSGQQQGYAFLDLPEPYIGSSVPGLAVHAQGIVLDPLGRPGAVTNALSFVYR